MGFCFCATVFPSSAYQFPSQDYVCLQRSYQFNLQIPERALLRYVVAYIQSSGPSTRKLSAANAFCVPNFIFYQILF